MFSFNEWVVKGKVINISENPKGYFVNIKGIAENPNVFSSDTLTIDCWIPKRVLGLRKLKKQIIVKGRFKFKKGNCYIVADEII